MPKTRLNISLDEDIADFARIFAAENRITISDLMTQYLLTLKRKTEGQRSETILAHPAFAEAIQEMQIRLQQGKTTWHSYDKVFGD